MGLAYQAAAADADQIVFCGVHFMAETAKIVNPSKTVLLPDENAGCSLADAAKLTSWLNTKRTTRIHISLPTSIVQQR